MNQITRINSCGCFPTLPTAYSDALSYYEELAKLSNKMNEVINAINTDFADVVKENVDKYFNTIMVNAMYVSETKTIVLGKETTSTESELHTYNYTNETMKIGE